MLDLQKNFRPANCEVAPEIRIVPLPLDKSDTQTWSEMAICQLHGSDALLLDLFPFSANPPHASRRLALLEKSRPGLGGWRRPSLTTHGVGIPYKPDAANHLRFTKESTRSTPIKARRSGWAFCLNTVSLAMRPQAVALFSGRWLGLSTIANSRSS